ncbi:IS110 family transposase [Arthrobacter sp. 9AX]|uniref:IS110 family transposase n=1 Tax=Arthrobacter sp. 9AX TaxID=2653131 RepID=UPI001356B42A
MAVILDQQGIDIFVGLDVGKSGHHAVALDRAGRSCSIRPAERRIAVEGDPRFLVRAWNGPALVVDQPATIGALPVAVAQAAGATVGYLPGLAMRRIADLHPGQAKTDARDAAIIAEAARSMPHTLRSMMSKTWGGS